MTAKNLLAPGELLKSVPGTDDMELINRYTMEPLKPEEVFTFKLAACNDLVDRDWERFTVETLRGFAQKFPGHTVLRNHSWSANDQLARVYKAEVHPDTSGPVAGNRLVLYCYIPRLPQYEETITSISSGILRECSVGVSVAQCRCSICGANLYENPCFHRKGYEYDGKTCVGELHGAMDVYEVSLVAVPAQPDAGVVKGYKTGQDDPAQKKTNDVQTALAMLVLM